MHGFFAPGSVAVIGASSSPLKIGYEILRSLARSEFGGAVYPVNPRGGTIQGIQAYGSIEELPPTDMAVIVLPARVVPVAIESCGKQGIKRVVIVSGGFKELGEEGAALERTMTETAARHGIRLIGPNCIGIFNGENRLDTFFQPREFMPRPQAGNIAILSQSGTVGAVMLEWCASEGLGISKLVSYGNRCDVDEIDMLDYLENDPATSVIGMYIEGLESGRKFAETAQRVGMKKPIVLLKGGTSRHGMQAALSHTGSLAGDPRVFDDVLRPSGIIQVSNYEEMYDILKLLSMQPLPSGGGIGMVTSGAGSTVLAVDQMARSRYLTLPPIHQETRATLDERLPSHCVIANPVDITGSAPAAHFIQAMDALKDDAGIHIIICFVVYQNPPVSRTIDELYEYVGTAICTDGEIICPKFLIMSGAGGDFTKQQMRRFQSMGVPFIETPSRVIIALDHLVGYAAWRERIERSTDHRSGGDVNAESNTSA